MEQARALEAAVAQHVATIHRAACACAAGGGPEWDGLLRHYGLAPLDAQERSFIVSHMRLPRGAVPAEVRAAFDGLARWARGEAERLGATGQPVPASLHERLAGLVDHETAAYERAIGLVPAPAPAVAVAAPAAPASPAAPSLASIFANAQQTSKEVPWANMKYNAIANLTCVHCGGPQEQPQDFMCKYCRRPIAGAVKPTL